MTHGLRPERVLGRDRVLLLADVLHTDCARGLAFKYTVPSARALAGLEFQTGSHVHRNITATAAFITVNGGIIVRWKNNNR